MIYSYECSACKQRVERTFGMGAAPKQVACVCGKKADRVFTVNVNVPNPTHPARANRGKG